jgi:hypothetical protein
MSHGSAHSRTLPMAWTFPAAQPVTISGGAGLDCRGSIYFAENAARHIDPPKVALALRPRCVR